MRHVLSLFDLTTSEIQELFQLTGQLKQQYEQGLRQPLLQGRTMALLFEKPSLRTRVSFESGMAHLGGSTLFLGQDVGWGQREAIQDFARVLGCYVDVVVCRAKRHADVELLARHATCSVINGLTDYSHPCQALADLYTLQELQGPLPGKRLAYVGDAYNVTRSLAIACGKLGLRMSVASPPKYQLDAPFLERLRREVPQVQLELTDDPRQAVRGADAVYTDVWTSMGQEAEREQRLRDLAAYQVDSRLMQLAAPHACFLHCLPAHRGEEVTDDVLDGPQSEVIRQAANRMHVQKGLLAWLLK
ncbi:MAG: ornithine carbamoyltransferase [Pirellulaceae bacterium]|nr:ornithine carbamoyltransferase [Pirellulaceae bacterium]